ncbi:MULTISPECIES: DUF2637 domain-containing protein [Nocardia]|uniref:DUF2637 domain-containing protein n=1 Tax=Nocardia TaxID=1817 RepID=UPI0024548009|nr:MULTISPECIES: DUF2637 domain-containing protein [Nocardia]
MKAPSGTLEQTYADNTNDAAIRTARTFWWWVLGVSALVSVLGNGLHAWTRVANPGPAVINPAPGVTITLLPPLVAALLAAIVPIAVLVHTHGLALIVQVPTKYGWIAKGIVLLVVLLLAGGGFYLSWDALRELALQAGFGIDEAKLFPLLLDGSIGGATAVLLTMPPARARTRLVPTPETRRLETFEPRTHDLDSPATAEVAVDAHDESRRPLGDNLNAETGDTDRHSANDQVPEVSSHAETVAEQNDDFATVAVLRSLIERESSLHTSRSSTNPDEPRTFTTEPTRDWALVAKRLCAGAITRDPEQVAQVLYLAFDCHLEPGNVAARVGLKERTVRRLLDDARPHCVAALAS